MQIDPVSGNEIWVLCKSKSLLLLTCIYIQAGPRSFEHVGPKDLLRHKPIRWWYLLGSLIDAIIIYIYQVQCGTLVHVDFLKDRSYLLG